MLGIFLAAVLSLHCDGNPQLGGVSRRKAVGTAAGTVAAASIRAPSTSAAAPSTSAAAPSTSAAAPPLLRASWSATAGFSSKDFIAFDEGAYKSMRDDERRTPLFQRAIEKRFDGKQGELVVLDIGTGPEALLALMAARAGARKVYAIEANPEVAKRAVQAIANAEDVKPGTVTLVVGFSTEVILPEKVDLVLAEIVGSVASEEGAYATIRDAQARHLKDPYSASSYIPISIQTVAAPASYALHYALGPPKFDWGKLNEPLRLNCRDETAQLLAEPQVLEEISFSSRMPPAGALVRRDLSWRISSERIRLNEMKYLDELRREGASDAEAKPLAAAVARSLSGLAAWPRLVLDEQATLIVESRGERGEHQKSHWQTVLPLLSARPVQVAADDRLNVRSSVALGAKVDTPVQYTIEGGVEKAMSRIDVGYA